ncbi:ABC transporter substrate-binding protein [Paenibacillus sp. YIM B09110]|uniref:ABC transporter substrate-binding protein n=1 Tax=Paenibacillus sp. YIM B09110 TaxID=3126102 RepID=UPI00301BF882
MKKTAGLILSIVLVLVISACGGNNGGNNESSGNNKPAGEQNGTSQPATEAPQQTDEASKEPITVTLGIFKNVTHAAGYIALENGYFQKNFGDHVKIEVLAFDNGSDFSTALATGEIDFGYTGPGPATNQFLKSNNFRVVSGADNGGAVLVAGKDSGVNSVKDLVGKTIAIPTKGSTNEISLRLLLKQEGVEVTTDSSGAQIVARAPSDTLVALRQNEVHATLIPEPWGTQIEQEGIGKVIVPWDQIPPNNGNYPLVILTASDKFISEHRDLVKAAIKSNLEAIEFIKANPDQSYELINKRLSELSGKGLDLELIKAAISHLTLTSDVNQAAIEEMAKVSIEAGYIKDITVDTLDLSKFIDTTLLEEVKNGQ